MIGRPSSLTSSRTTGLSGILIPTVFFLFLKSFGIWLFAMTMKVKGPGRFLFNSLNIVLSLIMVYSESWLMSWKIRERSGFSGFRPLKRAILSIDLFAFISHPIAYTVSVG